MFLETWQVHQSILIRPSREILNQDLRLRIQSQHFLPVLYLYLYLYLSVRPVPPRIWKLKFSGSKNGLSLNAFLETVEELRITRHVSRNELWVQTLSSSKEGRKKWTGQYLLSWLNCVVVNLILPNSCVTIAVKEKKRNCYHGKRNRNERAYKNCNPSADNRERWYYRKETTVLNNKKDVAASPMKDEIL